MSGEARKNSTDFCEQTVVVPPDRIGVLIGREGKHKRSLERLLGVRIEVDSKTGRVRIIAPSENVENLLKAVNVDRAISVGFSPDRAHALLDDDYFLDVIELRDLGISKKDYERLLGRVIGEKGKAKRLIEEVTETYLSIYRGKVAIIGTAENIEAARHAVRMLLQGRQHATVYRYLFSWRRRKKRERMLLWEKRY
ncbi:RNA-processing protein [archaeon]|nr:RNA-processing protein [archaeon]